MTRTTREGLLAAVLLLAWGICAGATALTLHRGTGYPPFFVSPGAEGGAPVVSAFRPTLLGGSAGELRLGDHVLAVNGADVAGLGAAGFFVRFVELVPTGGPTAVTYLRDGATATTTVVPSRR